MTNRVLERALEMAVEHILSTVPKGTEYCYKCPCDDECYGSEDDRQCLLNIMGWFERKAKAEGGKV